MFWHFYESYQTICHKMCIYILLHYIILYSILFYYIILYSILFYYIILYSILFYYIILYYIYVFMYLFFKIYLYIFEKITEISPIKIFEFSTFLHKSPESLPMFCLKNHPIPLAPPCSSALTSTSSSDAGASGTPGTTEATEASQRRKPAWCCQGSKKRGIIWDGHKT